MRGRVGLFIGFGAGYVLGSKAGRERYEQIQRLYENLQSSPVMRRARGRAKDAVGSGLTAAKDKASEGIHKVRDRGSDEPNLSVAPQ